MPETESDSNPFTIDTAVQSALPDVLRLAQTAGEEIMAIYRRVGKTGGLQVATKSDDSPVTEADIAANDILVAGLPGLLPGVPIVSEEDPESLQHRRPNGRFWLLDPLDGTREFIARSGEFTVNVALIENGEAILGVVVAPAINESFWALRGGSAFTRLGDAAEQTIRVRPFPALSGAVHARHVLVVASRTNLDQNTAAYIDSLQPHRLSQAGSSLKFCRVAQGQADCYPRMGPTSEWDTGAAQAVVEAAGGYVLDRQGQPLRYGKPDVLNPDFIVTSRAEGW